MYFNTCLNLSKKEIKNSLSKDKDSFVAILLYLDKEGDNNELVKKLLVEDTNTVNSATGDTKVFTFIDKKWQDLTIKATDYGANEEILTTEDAYKKMLFFGTTFGIGVNYPAIIIFRPRVNEYIALSLRKMDFKNDLQELRSMIIKIVLSPFDGRTFGRIRPLRDIYNWAKEHIISSSYKENYEIFDLPESFDGPFELLSKKIEESGMQNKEIAGEIGVSAATISQWKAGERTPTRLQVMYLCKAIGLTIDGTNLMLDAYEYAHLSELREKDRELMEYFEEHNISTKPKLSE